MKAPEAGVAIDRRTFFAQFNSAVIAHLGQDLNAWLLADGTRVEVGDSQELAVRIAGNAEVFYAGDPTLSTAVYGSGKVTRCTP